MFDHVKKSSTFLWVSAALLFLATAVEGATHHASAFLLRFLVAIVCVIVWPKHKPRADLSSHVIPLVCFVVVLIGLLFAPNRGLALQPFLTVAFVLVLYYAILLGEAHASNSMIAVCIGVGFMQALWAISQHFIFNEARAAGGFFNPNNLAAWLTPLCFLLLIQYPVWQTKKIIVLSVLVLGILSTGSRSALLAFIVALLFFIYPLVRNKWLFAGFILILGSAGFWLLSERFLGSNDAYAYSRLPIWYHSLRLGWQNFFFGVGLLGYEDAMRVFGVPLQGYVHFPKSPEHAHNELINAFVEIGILGVVAILLPLGLLLKKSWHLPLDKRFQLWAVCLTFIIPACFSNTLHVSPIAFLLTIFAAQSLRKLAEQPRYLPIEHGIKGKILLSCYLIVLLLTALPGVIGTLAQQHALYLKSEGKVKEAYRYGLLARYSMPYSINTGMLLQNLRYVNNTPKDKIVQSLARLGDRFPQSVEPHMRAVWLAETQLKDFYRLWYLIRLRQEVVKRDPNNADAYVNLGRLELEKNKTKALKTFQHALLLEPYCARALAYVAADLQEQGKLEEAKQLALKAQFANALSHQQNVLHAKKILALDATTHAMVKKILQ